MKRWAQVWILVATLTVVGPPAFAQTSASAPPPVRTADRWSVNAVVGAGAVHDASLLAGAEFIRRLSSRFGIVLDLAYARHVETASDAAAANTIATWLQQTQDQPAAGHARSSALLAAGGLRYILDVHRSWRPYVVGTGGIARVSAAAGFTLGGTDISSTLDNYAVVLGPDLHGAEIRPMFGGGGGVLLPMGALSLDLGYRLTSIRRAGGAANLNALQLGVAW